METQRAHEGRLMMLAAGLVMRVHFISASACSAGAFRVITASVQQASQTIEIKGAPPGGLSGALSGASDPGEEFRAAFAANVRDNAAGDVAKPAIATTAAQAPLAEDISGEGKVSAGVASYKAVSSKQPPVPAKVAVLASEGGPAKASVKTWSLARATVSSIASGSATEAAPAATSTERSSIAGGRSEIVSTEDASLTSLPQRGVEAAARVEAQPVSATAVVKRAPLTAVANGLADADSALADVPAISAADVKQPAGATANAGPHIRKVDTSDANKTVASRVPDQSFQTSFAALSVGLAATAGPSVSLPAAPQIGAVPKAAELPRFSEGVSLPVLSPVPAIAERAVTEQHTVSGAQVSSAASSAGAVGGDARFAQVQLPGSLDKGIGLPQIGPVVAEQAQAAQATSAAQTNQGATGVGAVGRQLSSVADQNLPTSTLPEKADISSAAAAALSNRSSSASERVPVSTVVQGASSSGGADRRIGLRETLQSEAGAAETRASVQTSEPERLSQLVPVVHRDPAAESGTTVKQQPTQSDARTSVGGSVKTEAGTDNELVAAPTKAGTTEVSLQAAGAKPVDVHIDSSVLAPVARQAESPQTALAAAPSVTAASKDKSVKRSAADLVAASVEPQSGSGTIDVAAAPVVIASGSKDGVHSVAAVASGNVAVPLAHPAAVAIGVPVHAGAPAVSASANTANAHTEAGLGGVLAAQPSAATQSVEPHRTLLATPTALEVGVQNGTQGWLKIRAEVGGQGEVKASLDAVSAGGRDLLHSQLPALNAFLHSEQMPVTASVAERSLVPDSGAGGTSAGPGGNDGFAASNGSSPQGDGQRQAGQQVNLETGETVSEMVKSYDALGGVSDSAVALSGLLAGTSAESGRRLNVRV